MHGSKAKFGWLFIPYIVTLLILAAGSVRAKPDQQTRTLNKISATQWKAEGERTFGSGWVTVTPDYCVEHVDCTDYDGTDDSTFTHTLIQFSVSHSFNMTGALQAGFTADADGVGNGNDSLQGSVFVQYGFYDKNTSVLFWHADYDTLILPDDLVGSNKHMKILNDTLFYSIRACTDTTQEGDVVFVNRIRIRSHCQDSLGLRGRTTPILGGSAYNAKIKCVAVIMDST